MEASLRHVDHFVLPAGHEPSKPAINASETCASVIAQSIALNETVAYVRKASLGICYKESKYAKTFLLFFLTYGY